MLRKVYICRKLFMYEKPDILPLIHMCTGPKFVLFVLLQTLYGPLLSLHYTCLGK